MSINAEYIERIETILKFFRDTVHVHGACMTKKNWCDDKTQDLLHELELVPHSFNERGKIGKELAEVRQQRRTAKDTMELLAPLVEWCNRQKPAIDAMTRVLGEMRKINEKQGNRLYYKRADGNHEIIGGARND